MPNFTRFGQVLALAIWAVTGASHAPAAEQQLLSPRVVQAFYANNEQTAIWQDDQRYDALLIAIDGLTAHGLDPAHYHRAALHTVRNDRAARERLATDAWFSAAAHLVQGKLTPEELEPDWSADPRQVDLPAHLRFALADGGIAGSLERLAPDYPAYRALKAELARLRPLQAAEKTHVPAGPTMKTGMAGPRIAALRERLDELGYPTETDGDPAFFGEWLENAVETFQFDYGLVADGLAGKATLGALNRGVAGKIERLRVNMERWRWLPDDLGRRHVRVNIAAFETTAFENGTAVHTYLAITGRPYRKTPVFSDQIEYLIFNPWWETPRRLARLDKLPQFRRDPGAVWRLGFQVLDINGYVVNPSEIDWMAISADAFPYRLRQAPGPQNALGKVKIMFPNQHAVYLHDTPTRSLFARSQRAFSSGCVRVERALDLSAWLLEETPGWSRSKVDATVASGRETRVNLAAQVPVHILYLTVIDRGDGSVRYLDDIYGRDPEVLAGLNQQPASQ